MTSLAGVHNTAENPYHDGLEGDILTYTAAGKVGEQTLSGMNIRLTQQRDQIYPIHGFSQIASRRDRNVGPKRWRYMGLLEYLRHYSDTQVDSRGGKCGGFGYSNSAFMQSPERYLSSSIPGLPRNS